jgi:hypothetical protein
MRPPSNDSRANHGKTRMSSPIAAVQGLNTTREQESSAEAWESILDENMVEAGLVGHEIGKIGNDVRSLVDCA